MWNRNPKVEETIYHVPKVLYHWRCHNDSTAANPQSKRYAYEAGKQALQDFVDSRGWNAKVEELPHVGFYRVIYEGGIFSQRQDIAAIGKKEIQKGKIVSGAFDKDGKMLYQGLLFCYSGYIHRAVLAQNVAELDIDKWKLNPKCEKIVKRFEKGSAEWDSMSKLKRQKTICDYLTSLGYRLYWEPSERG